MSIIVTKITQNNAFVFSEGNLTFNGTVVDTNFDKTISLFSNKVICAFCGEIVLTNNITVADILRQIERNTVTFNFSQFLLDVESEIQNQLSIFLPSSNRSIQLHVICQVNDVNNPFHFIDYLFTANPNQVNFQKVIDVNTGNLYRPDGESTAFIFLMTDLGLAGYTTNPNLVIQNTVDSIQRAIDVCVAAGINTCGGTKFHQIL